MTRHEDKLCELHRLPDAGALSDVVRVLEAHGVEAGVWAVRGRRLTPWAAEAWRLMVRCRDVVYARWIAAEAGLDTWPGDEASGEG